MKRITMAMILVLIILAVTVNATGVRKYSTVFDWSVRVIDSTSGKLHYVDSLTGGTTGFPIYYTNITSDGEPPYPTKVSGLWSVYVTKFDSGTNAADIPDLTKDTIALWIYTAWPNPLGSATATGDRTSERCIAVCTLLTAGLGTTNIVSGAINIPSDSVIGTVLYGRIKSNLQDTDHTISAVTGHIHYRGYVTMIAR